MFGGGGGGGALRCRTRRNVKFPGNETLILRAEKQQERIQKFQKGGAGSQILERGGGGIRLFSAAFSHFLINLLQIFQQKGGRGPSGPSPKSAPEAVMRNCSGQTVRKQPELAVMNINKQFEIQC